MMARVWSERERYLVAGVGALVLVVLLIVGLGSYFAALQEFEERADRAAGLVSRLEEVQPEVLDLREQMRGQRSSTPRNVSATVLMENSAASIGLRDRLVSLRPQTASAEGPVLESLEAVVENIRLAELVRWLYQLETAPGGHQVTQLRLRKRFDDQELFDATLVLVRFREGGS